MGSGDDNSTPPPRINWGSADSRLFTSRGATGPHTKATQEVSLASELPQLDWQAQSKFPVRFGITFAIFLAQSVQ